MIISSPDIRGTGRITGAFPSPDGSLLAVASVFPLLTNPPGRSCYAGQNLRYRLGLYRRGAPQPLAVFDQARLPINDVAFHPSEPVVAIGAGSYDGGWMFEGELSLWDWSEGRSWPGAGQVPEVVRCSFDESGDRIDLEVLPWDEEWGAEPGAGEPLVRTYGLSLAYSREAATEAVELDPAAPLAPAGAGAEMPDPSGALEATLAGWFGLDRRVGREAIWDVAWLDDGRLAAVHDQCLLEIHDLASGSVVRLEGEGYGAAILRTSPPIVHAVPSGMEQWEAPRSRLLAIRGDGLEPLAEFEGTYTFTSSTRGAILGRLDRHRAGACKADVIVDIASRDARFRNLGHYDCFNHYIGIDGAPDLFLLQGRPPGSHEHKRLCRVSEEGKVEPLWPLLPADGSHASHAMECLGCHVDDEAGPGVVVAGRHYHPDPSTELRGFLYRKPAGADRELWRHSPAAAASAMVDVRDAGIVAVALLDGSLLLLDSVSGEARMNGRATIEGIPTVVYSMDVSGLSLALGTFDGRVAVVEVDRLLGDGAAPAGRVELAGA